MSSVLRVHAQIPSRVKYFVWGQGDESTLAIPAASAFSMDVGEYKDVTSMADVAELIGANATARGIDTDPFDARTVNLLKDLGRQITVYDPTIGGAHVAVYRQVQIVNGAETEGVGGSAPEWDSNYFVKVWSANGEGINVVRTG